MSIITSSGARAPIVLTPEQARILYDLVQVNAALLQARWSPGIWYGLMDALVWIEAAGGAYVDDQQNPLSCLEPLGKIFFPTPSKPLDKL